MQPLALLFSASGRIARKPFALAVLAVYLVSFLSQLLLASPVTARASVFPFLLLQIAAGWAWTALHMKRLRDAGRPIGAAVALAVLYGLAVVLLLLVTALATAPVTTGPDETPGASFAQILLLFFLLAAIFSDPHLGMFAFVILGALALIMLPIVVALLFTIWLATRPSVPTMP